jgi:type I restriction enzyme S subunit
LEGFDKEWEIHTIGELARLYQPATISAADFTESGYPVYGANGIVGFYKKTNHVTWQVTVTCRGSTCGTVNRTVDRCWITGNAMVLNCDNNPSIVKEFFYHLISYQDFSNCITGTGQPQIVRTPLSNFEIKIPSDSQEQLAIANVLAEMDDELFALEGQLSKVQKIKDGMMQQLLTGRVRLV